MEHASASSRPAATVPWSPSHDTHLRGSLLPAAALAKDITARFGVVRSEAAVRSRAAHIGLTLARNTAADISRAISNRHPPVEPRPARLQFPPVRPATDTAVNLVALELGACRFPVGAGTGLRQLYCGRPAPAGDSYCPRCRQRAYLPASQMSEAEQAMALKAAGAA